jgi:transglutaminase-like putative cysteine protease
MTALALAVGCEFEFESTQAVAAVVQVAPSPQPGVRMRREVWDTDCDHHGYVDLYGNRCERFRIPAGHARVAYEAELALTAPADAIDPGAVEVAVEALPDEVMGFVMPSRFCLPDELGHEAWQRFGHLAPGWSRVQAIVDFVHDHLTWVAGASNPWTTAADAYRAGQGVCRD